MRTDLVHDMLEFAKEQYPHEACGLIVASGKRARLLRATNVSEKPKETFEIDEAAWLAVQDHEEVIGIFHSHCDLTAEPSPADLSACEATSMPWHIVSYPGNDYRIVEPCGYRAPYLNRAYVHGVHDCYSIVRDWYMWEAGICLPNFDRQDCWWEKGQNLYVDLFEGCGFVEVKDEKPQRGDAFLIQARCEVPNHAAVYLGDGTMIHHVHGRLSTLDPWGGYWEKHTSHILRHKDMVVKANG